MKKNNSISLTDERNIAIGAFIIIVVFAVVYIMLHFSYKLTNF